MARAHLIGSELKVNKLEEFFSILPYTKSLVDGSKVDFYHYIIYTVQILKVLLLLKTLYIDKIPL